MASRIAGITVEIGGDTTKLQTALKGVNSEIRNTQAQLKDVDKLLKLDPGNTELLAQKHKLLGEAINETKNKLQTLKTAASQADEALKNGTISQEQYDGLQREIAETEQKLKDLETAANQSATALQKIAATGDKLKSVGDSVSSVGKSLTTHVTLPLAAAGAAGVKSFAEVDKTMQLANKTMGNTATEAEMVDKAMTTAAANSTYGVSDAANAMLNFARAGLDAKESSDALAPAMNLAAGEGGDLDTVSAGLVATINGFHGSFSEASNYADVFASACNNSALDVNSLSSAMSVAAPIFSAAGYKVNDAALYMGVMANNGIDADKAANSLKTGLARLVSPAKEGADMMEQLGISVTNSDGSMKDSITVQKELHDAFAQLSESEQIAAASAIFGKNQMAPWLALINTAPTDVDNLSNSINNCSGLTDEMADTMMSGFGGSIEQLKSSLDVLVYTLGQTLAPTIQKVVNAIQGLVNWLNSLTPAQRSVVVHIGLIVAAIGPVLLIVGKLISTVGTIMTVVPKLAGIINTVKGAFAALNATMLANPIVLIIAAIAALVAAFIYLWNTNEEFRQFWIDLWNNIKEVAVAVWEGLKEFFASAWEAIKTTAVTVWTAISEFFSGLWEGIKTLFTTVVTVISTFLSTAWNTIKTTATTVWTAISTFFSTLWNGIKTTFTTAVNAISTFLTTAWNTIKSTVTTVWTAISTFFTTMWNGIKTIFTTVVTAIQTFLTTAWNTIKTVATTVWNAIKTTIQTVMTGIQTVITTVWNAIKTAITTVINAIKTTITTVWNSIKAAVTTVANGIKTAVTTAFTNMLSGIRSICGNIYSAVKGGFDTAINFVKGLASQTFKWGADFIGGIVNGIKSMIGKVGEAVSSVAEKIKSILHFSVPDEGPLTDYESWMPDFIGGLAKGIEKSRGMIDKAMTDVAGDMVISPQVLAAQGAIAGGGSSGSGDLLSGITGALNTALAGAGGGGDIVIPVYLGTDMIDEVVVTAQQRVNLKSGGR